MEVLAEVLTAGKANQYPENMSAQVKREHCSLVDPLRECCHTADLVLVSAVSSLGAQQWQSLDQVDRLTGRRRNSLSPPGYQLSPTVLSRQTQRRS